MTRKFKVFHVLHAGPVCVKFCSTIQYLPDVWQRCLCAMTRLECDEARQNVHVWIQGNLPHSHDVLGPAYQHQSVTVGGLLNGI